MSSSLITVSALCMGVCPGREVSELFGGQWPGYDITEDQI